MSSLDARTRSEPRLAISWRRTRQLAHFGTPVISTIFGALCTMAPGVARTSARAPAADRRWDVIVSLDTRKGGRMSNLSIWLRGPRYLLLVTTQAQPVSDDRDIELLDELATARTALVSQIGRRIIGQKQTVDDLVAALLAGGHVLLAREPGLTQTLFVQP